MNVVSILPERESIQRTLKNELRRYVLILEPYRPSQKILEDIARTCAVHPISFDRAPDAVNSYSKFPYFGGVLWRYEDSASGDDDHKRSIDTILSSINSTQLQTPTSTHTKVALYTDLTLEHPPLAGIIVRYPFVNLIRIEDLDGVKQFLRSLTQS
jgi:hypothetical protein